MLKIQINEVVSDRLTDRKKVRKRRGLVTSISGKQIVPNT